MPRIKICLIAIKSQFFIILSLKHKISLQCLCTGCLWHSFSRVTGLTISPLSSPYQYHIFSKDNSNHPIYEHLSASPQHSQISRPCSIFIHKRYYFPKYYVTNQLIPLLLLFSCPIDRCVVHESKQFG